ncbi:MAG TPA: rhodanese-like domain-containing protein [Acidimicrobiales bacterium]|nr:rhodanese-like domain-containing protein [Acidimicrobiales bacterium]
MTTDSVPGPDIDPEAARLLVQSGAFLVDVREDEEWQAGHAPEAVHLAMGLVPDRMDELPTDRTVVCICRVGGRSGAVASSLAEAGFDVRNVDGGMLAWELAGFPVVTDGGGPGRIV